MKTLPVVKVSVSSLGFSIVFGGRPSELLPVNCVSTVGLSFISSSIPFLHSHSSSVVLIGLVHPIFPPDSKPPSPRSCSSLREPLSAFHSFASILFHTGWVFSFGRPYKSSNYLHIHEYATHSLQFRREQNLIEVS